MGGTSCLRQEECEEREEEKGYVEESVDELAERVGDGEDVGEKVFGNGVGLVFEPLQADDDEEDTAECGDGSGDDHPPARAK